MIALRWYENGSFQILKTSLMFSYTQLPESVVLVVLKSIGYFYLINSSNRGASSTLEASQTVVHQNGKVFHNRWYHDTYSNAFDQF